MRSTFTATRIRSVPEGVFNHPMCTSDDPPNASWSPVVNRSVRSKFLMKRALSGIDASSKASSNRVKTQQGFCGDEETFGVK